ncbi:helix-turn-helix domain-containing protein [Vagococcus hydrophili]|uniref:Helix-turn-helix transcriptional regulator n=1 Tax=Vagococcus hydrophili TaxID=2714947 RepID=A0A6G8AUR4_9ENTE|nr:helix-turn-helix transcriptional regulator [Vagococcus hydrophili]QIL48709.1 helix-turn-helix transcriptional regulator [Vagococcus hydrophili]
MNVDCFIEARKSKGLSQSELAENICTQTTLSRFENNGQVPNLKTLIKLCTRLDFPIGDLFPKVGLKNTEVVKKMDKIEFYFITSEYEEAQNLLESLKITSEDENSDITLRYLYLKGFLMFFRKEELTDILFTFDQILLNETTTEKKMYQLLAYTGIGMTYARENDFEKSEFYFSKVIGQIYDCPTNSIEDMWRVLNMVFHAGVYYAETNEIEISNALLEYAITICSENHVTYYLARAAFQLALNSVVEKKDIPETLELLYDARAYAKVNGNQVLLKKIKALEIELKEV